MKKIALLVLGLNMMVQVFAGDEFNIRGVLPWHNFLSGPSAWNEADYEKYLDTCQAEGINFIGFHNYTGGGERYATYVEPMIKITYKGIVPTAYFDNSHTCRWGYLPMSLDEYAFGSEAALEIPRGAKAFGSDASVLSKNQEEQYASSQHLMRNVLGMAHQRGMRMAMGFEFGVIPPEYFSLNVAGDRFYWSGESNMIPNPKSQIAAEIHHAALDNLLDAYPTIDYIWLWLNEHSFMGVDLDKALQDKAFAETYAANKAYFNEAPDDSARFVGVWALEYIRMSYAYLKSKGSKAKIIVGGWGGGNQLPSLLKGLDSALPSDIVFSCLNPDLGKAPQPDFLADIAKNRTVWAVPWLEGDHQLWHFQPRVDMMREHVSLAAKQNLDGVIAIHWRTNEPRFNFKTFARFASNKNCKATTEELYIDFLSAEFGKLAAEKLAPMLAEIDRTQLFGNVPSPEFFAYTPEWGMLDDNNRVMRERIVAEIDTVLSKLNMKQRTNIERFKAMFVFELLLNDVERKMMPAFEMKKSVAQHHAQYTTAEYAKAYAVLCEAPLEQMFRVYVSRVASRGEMGVLSSLNQRVWREYNELKQWLEVVK